MKRFLSEQTDHTELDHQNRHIKANKIHVFNQLSNKLDDQFFLFSQLVNKTVRKIKDNRNRLEDLVSIFKQSKTQFIYQISLKLIFHLNAMISQINNIFKILQQNKLKTQYSLELNNEQKNKYKITPRQSQMIGLSNIRISNLIDILIHQNQHSKRLQMLNFKINYAIKEEKLHQKQKSLSKRLSIYISKQGTLTLILPYVLQIPLDDLFNYDKSHMRWITLTNHYIKTIVYGEEERVCKSFDSFIGYMSILIFWGIKLMKNTFIFSNSLENQPLLEGDWSELINSLMQNDPAMQQLKTVYSLENQNLPKALWDITRLKYLEYIINPVLSSISFSQCIYILRKYQKAIFLAIKDQQYQFLMDDKLEKINFQNLSQEKQYKTHIQVRVNSNFGFRPKEKIKKLTIAIHIHGGGFISMSSYIQQFYIRQWVKNLNIPFFSIDYGKAPQFPFPWALADCIQSYLWIYLNAPTLYQAQQINIILIGDSSGGNLASSVVNFLIANKLPLPKQLILIYPALRVEIYYSPSFLYGIDDMILPHSALLKIIIAYVGNFQDKKSMYITPLNAKDDILRKYPTTYFFVGSSDPLSDDSFRMLEKLNTQRAGNAYMTVFKYFPHGFLHFHTDTLNNYYSKMALQQIQKTLQNILQSK